MTEARRQLADTQAQLAEARRRMVARQDIITDLLNAVSEEKRRATAAEARLEAVAALAEKWENAVELGTGRPSIVLQAIAAELRAALSVVPQPPSGGAGGLDFHELSFNYPGPVSGGAS